MLNQGRHPEEIGRLRPSPKATKVVAALIPAGSGQWFHRKPLRRLLRAQPKNQIRQQQIETPRNGSSNRLATLAMR